MLYNCSVNEITIKRVVVIRVSVENYVSALLYTTLKVLLRPARDKDYSGVLK